MARIKGVWYPDSAKSRYIFLKTLEEDNSALYLSAISELNLINGENSKDFQDKMVSAFSFLKTAIQNEKRKENNFLRERFKKFPKLCPPKTEDFDYYKLIRNINLAIQGADRLQAMIKQEKKKDVRSASYKRNDLSFTQVANTQAEELLNYLSGRGRGPRFAKNKKIYDTIINEIYRRIKKTGKEMPMESFFTMVLTLSISAMEILNDNFKGNDTSFSLTDMKKSPIFNQVFTEMDKAFSDMSEEAKDYNAFLDECKKTFSFLGFKTGGNEIKRSKIEKKIDFDEKISKKAAQWLRDSKNRDCLLRIELSHQRGKFAELFTGKEFDNIPNMPKVRDSIVKAFNTGASQTLTDITVRATFNADISLGYEGVERVDKGLNEIMNDMFKVGRQEQLNQQKNIFNEYQSIEEDLKKINEELGDIQKNFIIHNNVKDYKTIGSRYEAFSGGTDWRLAPFMSFLSSLSDLGFVPGDIEFLQFAILNCLPGTVGTSNKNAIEKYLSAFAVMMLFSDGLTMAMELSNNIEVDTSSLNVLHLFNVNGIFVPASYLLQVVYDEMMAKSEQISQDGVKITINGGIPNPREEIRNYQELKAPRWDRLLKEEKEAISFQITFLASFFDILDNL